MKRRVDRLVETGVGKGFTALVGPWTLGWTTEAHVQIQRKGTVSPDQLSRSREQLPEVVGACTVSGQADALVHVLAADVHHLERALESLRADPHVDHGESAIVLSRLIDRGKV